MIPRFSSVSGLVSSGRCARLESPDRLERRHPFPSPLRVGFGEIQVRIVVSGITCNNQTGRRHLETGRAIGVRMPQLNRDKHGRRQRDDARGGDCLAGDPLQGPLQTRPRREADSGGNAANRPRGPGQNTQSAKAPRRGERWYGMSRE
jgi:hypothetical protein